MLDVAGGRGGGGESMRVSVKERTRSCCQRQQQHPLHSQIQQMQIRDGSESRSRAAAVGCAVM